MSTVGPGVREIRIHESDGAFRVIYLAARAEGIYVPALLSEEVRADQLARHRAGNEAIQGDFEGRYMKPRKNARDKHGPRHVTPAGRSVLRDLFAEEEAIELEIRSTLLRGLERWLDSSGMTQTEAAKVLGITQARVSDLKRGKISQFSLDLLIRLAARAGLQPSVKLAA